MVIVKKTGVNEIYKPIQIAIIGHLIALMLFSTAAYLSMSPNLIASTASLILVLTSPIAAYISYKNGEKENFDSKNYMVLTTVIILIGTIVLLIGSYIFWIALIGKPLIKKFEFALTIPIIDIVIIYFTAEMVERKVPELYWRAARSVSDRIRGGVSAAAVSLVGPTIAFFGLTKFDAYLAPLPIMYAIIELHRSISEFRAGKKQESGLNDLKEGIKNAILTIPAVISTDEVVLKPLNRFIISSIKVSISDFLSDEEISNVIDYIKTYVVENIGVVTFIKVEADRAKPEKIRVAIPLSDGEKVSENFNTEKYALIDLSPNGEMIGRREIELGIKDERMVEVQKVKQLVREGATIIGVKQIDHKALREAEGWVVKVIKLDSKDLNGAIKEVYRKLKI